MDCWDTRAVHFVYKADIKNHDPVATNTGRDIYLILKLLLFCY